jgi:hypothetical protein
VVAATAPITYNSGTQTVSTSLATNKLLGRATAGTGVAEEITLGTNLSFSGTTLNATGGGGGATPAGVSGSVQINNGAGGLGSVTDLKWDSTNTELDIPGSINLDDGTAGFVTTLQTITPTAARTISLPDATGTVALVAGSSGQLLWNNAGVNAGASTLTYDGSILTTSGRFINSYNATASSPAKAFTGTWFTGGTGTTTKPQVLIEPTGATSTAWSTSGTGLGVNAASGFAGNLLDLQVNGTRNLSIAVTNGSVPDFIQGTTSLFNLHSSGGNAGASLRLNSGISLAWNTGMATSGADLILARDAANTLAQRNGTNAQTSRVYNTYTSDTNYERAKLEWSSNVFRIGTEKGSGGGTARALEFQTDGTTRLTITTAGTPQVQIKTQTTSFNDNILLTTTSNGIATIWDSNATDFGRLNFGGTTTSFPALKRSSAILQARLADDSAYTTIDAQHRLQGTAPATASSTGTAGDVRYDTDYVYICTATNTWKRAALTTW